MQTRRFIRWAIAAVLAASAIPLAEVQRLEQRQGRWSRRRRRRASSPWRTRTTARRLPAQQLGVIEVGRLSGGTPG